MALPDVEVPVDGICAVLEVGSEIRHSKAAGFELGTILTAF